MRKIKKGLCVFLAMMLCTAVSVQAAAASAELELEQFELEYFDASGPNAEVLESVVDVDALADYLIAGFASCPSAGVNISSFKIKYNSENWTALANLIMYETPELFHINSLGGSTSGGYLYTVKAGSSGYLYTANQYASMMSEIEAEAEKFLRGVKGNSKLTDVEKALILHDRIAAWATYDTDFSTGQQMRNMYGILVAKEAVCMGYAYAYDYLLEQVGIESYYCSSTLLNHAWNVVYIGGKPYHVDVTWDDPSFGTSDSRDYEVYGYVGHDNFLRSTNGIAATGHVSNNQIDYNTAPTDTTYDSYFWQDVTSSFELIGEDLYYIDRSVPSINKMTDMAISQFLTIDSKWYLNSGSYYGTNKAYLSSDGESLYYNDSKNVKKLNASTKAVETVWAPAFSSGTSYVMNGFTYRDCQFICNLQSDLSNNSSTVFQTATKEQHLPSDWIITKNPTEAQTGEKQIVCELCSAVLQTEVIPVLTALLNAVDETVVEIANGIIYGDTYASDNISDFVTPKTGSTQITVTPYISDLSVYGSGTVIRVTDGSDTQEYILVIEGDLNGDGACDVLDGTLAGQLANGKLTPENWQCYAGNGATDPDFDAATYQNVTNSILTVGR